jgi:uncharacterized protein YjdB
MISGMRRLGRSTLGRGGMLMIGYWFLAVSVLLPTTSVAAQPTPPSLVHPEFRHVVYHASPRRVSLARTPMPPAGVRRPPEVVEPLTLTLLGWVAASAAIGAVGGAISARFAGASGGEVVCAAVKGGLSGAAVGIATVILLWASISGPPVIAALAGMGYAGLDAIGQTGALDQVAGETARLLGARIDTNAICGALADGRSGGSRLSLASRVVEAIRPSMDGLTNDINSAIEEESGSTTVFERTTSALLDFSAQNPGDADSGVLEFTHSGIQFTDAFGGAARLEEEGSFLGLSAWVAGQPNMAYVEVTHGRIGVGVAAIDVFVNGSPIATSFVGEPDPITGLAVSRFDMAGKLVKGRNEIRISRSTGLGARPAVGSVALVASSAGLESSLQQAPSLHVSTAISVAGEPFTVSWSAVAGATEYQLERTQDGSFLDFGPVRIETTSFQDRISTPGVTRSYRVRADNSTPSSTVSVTSAAPPSDGQMFATPSDVLFFSYIGGPRTAAREIEVAIGGRSKFSWKATTQSTGGWLRVVGSDSGTESVGLVLRADPDFVDGPGTHQGRVVLSSAEADAPITVPVSFQVSSGGGGSGVDLRVDSAWFDIAPSQIPRGEDVAISTRISNVGSQPLQSESQLGFPVRAFILYSNVADVALRDVGNARWQETRAVNATALNPGQSRVFLKENRSLPSAAYSAGWSFITIVADADDVWKTGSERGVVDEPNDTDTWPDTNNRFVFPFFIPRAPKLVVSPASAHLTISKEGLSAVTLEVSNDGDGVLEWAVSSDTIAVAVSPVSGSNQASVVIAVDASDLPPGDHAFVVTVSSNAGTITVPLTVTVDDPQPLAVADTARLVMDEGVFFSHRLTATGGAPPLVWSVIPGGSMPEGLRVSPSGELSGVPTAVGTSSFRVRVADETGLSSEATISATVRAAQTTAVVVSPARMELLLGADTAMSGVRIDALGRIRGDLPLSWRSSDASVAAVDAAGRVTALSAGTVLVIGSVDSLADTAVVVVRSQSPVASVVISTRPRSILVGDSVELTATALDSLGASLADQAVSWSVLDSSVAIVSERGILKGLKAGGTDVVAQAESAVDTVHVEVLAAQSVALLEVTPDSVRLTLGDTLRFVAVVRDAAGGVIQRSVTWTSGGVAAVIDSLGLVTALSDGESYVVAFAEGVADTAWVTVAGSGANPLASYSFESCTADDGSGNAWNATASGTLPCVPGAIGNGLRFDGQSFARVDSFDLSANDFTASFWFRVDSLPEVFRSPFAVHSGGGGINSGDRTIQTLLLPGLDGSTEGRMVGVFTTADGAQRGGGPEVEGITLGDWQHVAFVREAGVQTLYLNGEASAPFADGLGSYEIVGGLLEIGAPNFWGGSWADNSRPGAKWLGDLDELRLFSRAMSLEEVRALYDERPHVASVVIAPRSATLKVGDKLRLTAATRDPAGVDLGDRVVRWSSSDTNVVSIDQGGVMVARGVGSARVFATSEGVADTIAVSVLLAVPGGIIAYYPLDGDATDSTGLQPAGVISGARSVADRVAHGESSFLFDGQNDYVSLGDLGKIDFEASGGSLTAWVRPEHDPPPGARAIVGVGDASDTRDFVLTWSGGSFSGRMGANAQIGTDPVYPGGQWYQVALTYADSMLQLYVDGERVGSASPARGIVSEKAFIGRDPHALEGFFAGSIDDVRIYSEALNSADVKSLFQAEGGSDGLVARYSFDSCGPADDSGNGHDAAASGQLQCVPGVIGKALNFDGASYARVSDFDLLLDDFSAVVWFKLDSIINWSIPLAIHSGGGGQNMGDRNISLWALTTPALFGVLTTADGASIAEPVQPLLEVPQMIGSWHHAAFVRRGGVQTLYVDGEASETKTDGLGVFEIVDGLFEIGAPNFWGGGWSQNGRDGAKWRGALDELALYNRALSEGEIRALYNGRATVASVRVTPRQATLAPGESVQLSASAADSLGNVLFERSVTWSTSDATIASVDSDGLVVGVSVGRALIVARVDGVSDTVTAEVLARSNPAVGSRIFYENFDRFPPDAPPATPLIGAWKDLRVKPDSGWVLVRSSSGDITSQPLEIASGPTPTAGSTAPLGLTAEQPDSGVWSFRWRSAIVDQTGSATTAAQVYMLSRDGAAITEVVFLGDGRIGSLGAEFGRWSLGKSSAFTVVADLQSQKYRVLVNEVPVASNRDFFRSAPGIGGFYFLAHGGVNVGYTLAVDDIIIEAATCTEWNLLRPLGSVDLGRRSMRFEVGDTARLTTTVTESGGSAAACAPTLTSSDTSVVVVDAEGLVTAAGPGTALVVASAGAVADTASVTVTEAASVAMLVRSYDFDESAEDGSGFAKHGTNHGAVPTTDRFGRAGRAFSFDGSTYVSVPPWEHGSGSSRSFAAWIVPGEGGYYQRSNYSTDKGGEWQLSWNPAAGKTTARVVIQPGDQVGLLTSAGSYPNDRWVHVVANWDLEADRMELYINGQIDTAVAIPDGEIGLHSRGRSTVWNIGGTWNGGDFRGKIDDVRIYKGVLSADEVRALYESEAPASVVSLTISPNRDTVRVSDSIQLEAVIRDAAGDTLLGRTATWTSLDTVIAVVNSVGWVTAKAQGSVGIVAESEGVADTARVIVTARSPADVFGWADKVEASQGDTVTVAVSIDVSAVNDGIGSVQGSIRFDATALEFVGLSTDFQGTFTPNTDSATAGVIRYAGINTSSTNNRDTTRVVALRLKAVGMWGSTTTVALEIPELSTTGFLSLADRLAVTDGSVRVNPGTFAMAVGGESSVSKTESKAVTVAGTLRDLKARIGSMSGRVTFDPAVVRVDSMTAGDYGGTFQSNTTMQADSGFVRFAIAHTSPATVDSAEFARVWMTAVGQGGDSTTIALALDEAADPVRFADLLPYLTSNTPLRVGVSTGLWGDPNRDLKVTALDALICLSGVVGKDVSQFDVTACDVAPDNGAAFTGRVTALDALAVLSDVVGKSLPPGFRVRRSR